MIKFLDFASVRSRRVIPRDLDIPGSRILRISNRSVLNIYPKRKYRDLDIPGSKIRKIFKRSVLNIYPNRKYYDLDIPG